MGATFQAIADRIGDESTLILAALFFGVVACAVALVMKGASSVLDRFRVGGMRAWLLAAGVALIAAYTGWQGLEGRPSHGRTQAGPQGEANRVPVHTALVGRKSFPVVLNGLGTVQPLNIVTVRSRVDGQIEKIAFEEGQMVREGDLLVQIDAAPFEAALNQ